MHSSFITDCRAFFFPAAKTSTAQTCELNRGRTEARCLIAFDASSTALDFPFVEQGARLTRCIDSQKHPAQEIQTEYLLCSLRAGEINAEQMLWTDRRYWGIETGLHLRLDVIAGEDRSRVCHPVSTLNLAVIRRAVVTVAIHWIKHCRNPRQATMSGFYDWMAKNNHRKAFSLVTARQPTWLPPS